MGRDVGLLRSPGRLAQAWKVTMIFVRSWPIVLALSATALLARAPPASDPGAPRIKDIVIDGNRRIQAPAILNRVRTKIGDPLAPAALRDDVRSIFDLGFFDDVQIRTEDFEGGVRVLFVVAERPLLREVIFEGNAELKTDELRETAAMKVGILYNPVAVQKAEEAIRQKYEDQGFFDFTISARTERTPEGDSRVVFQIDEGRKTIDRILADRLATLAPQIDSRQTTLRSFEFAFLWDLQKFTVRIRCWVEAPSSRACVILHDGIPVFVAIGNRVFMYNALDGPSLWHGDWGVRVGESSEGRFGYEFEVLTLGNAKAGVEVDLRPLPGRALSRRSVRMLGDQRYAFQGFTEAGGRLEAWIDLAEPIPYSRLRATFPAGGGLELERLKVNQPIPPVASQFPKFDEEGVVVPSARSVSNMEDAIQAMRLSPWTDWLIRWGMKDQEWRTKAESSLGRPIDWAGVASRDATIGHTLKRVAERHLQQLP
jgi:hypothetical protein